MARGTSRLTVRTVEAAAKVGRLADGGGLYLNVSKDGCKTWVFLYRSPVHRTQRKAKAVGRQREMGLGPVAVVTLAKARERAQALRRVLAEGRDPLDEVNAGAPAPEPVPTFGEMAQQVIGSLEAGWRNEKHRAQWRSTLATHAASLSGKPVDAIETADVLDVLAPIWTEKAETASRVRGRIEKILDAAKAKGHRYGENPARWRGHLDHLLPKRAKLQRGHHPAMPFDEVPGFIAKLRAMDGVAARCLEFLILSATRSGEARGARWAETDLKLKVWSIPADRMKAGKEHRVPFTDRMLQILEEMRPLQEEGGGYVFPGQRRSHPLSEMTLEAVLRRLKVKPYTTHGFRSSFKDWANETTSFPNELSEAALAHTTGDKVERAYRRGDALERRRELMAAWARHCDPDKASTVTPLRKAAR